MVMYVLGFESQSPPEIESDGGMKGNKKGLYRYISNKRMLLNGMKSLM